MTMRALVIGSQTGGLLGADGDARSIADALRKRGFEQIDLRTGTSATRDGILEGYAALIGACSKDDVAAIYYSGHGHYAVSRDAAADLPRTFQGIVPTDYDDSTDTDYRGVSAWELSILLARLTRSTRNAVVILDCCHAAQMSRDGAVRDAVPRALPHPLYLASFRPHIEALRARYPGELESLDVRGNADAVRMVACAQSESAFEYTSARGVRTGAFTEALLEVFQEIGDAPISWALLGQAVRDRVLRTFRSQRPDVEGPQHRRLFSLVEVDARGLVPVTATPAGARLAAGRLHGVSVGDVYAVMPVGAEGFAAATAIAELAVAATTGSSADAVVQRWLNGNTAIPAQAVAVPRTVAAARRPIKLIAPDEHRAAIEQAIVDTRTLRATLDDADRPLVALRLADGRLTIEDDKGALFPPAQFPRDLDGTVRNLKGIGVAHGLRELEGEYGISAANELTIQLGAVDDGELRVLPDRGASLGLGDRIGVRVQSRAMRQLYAHVFNVGVRGTVTRLTPFAPAGVPLAPGAEFVLGRNFATSALDGLRLFWPEGLPSESFPRIDEIIVIVTSEPSDLGGLETQAFIARGRGPGNRLAALLEQLQTGERQTRDAGGLAVTENYLVKRLSYFLHPRAGSIGDLEFAVDENPQLRASARNAQAWIGGAAPGAPGDAAAPAPIAVRLGELVVDRADALASPDLRIDALVCTRAGSGGEPYRATTLRLRGVKEGPLTLDGELFRGSPHDFLDVYLWISPDTAGTPTLAELFQQRAGDKELQDAASALQVTAAAAGSPWVTAVGASAVLARIADRLVGTVAGAATAAYRTSFLADERFGIGRHPQAGLHRAGNFAFALLVSAAPDTTDKGIAMDDGLVQLYEHFVPGYREGVARSDGIPLLTPELLGKIRNERTADPQGALERARRAINGGLTADDLDRLIRHLEGVFQDPAAAIRDATPKGMPVPRQFTFAGWETGDLYKFEPDSDRFSDADWTGFGLNCGSAILKRFFTGYTAFRWHTDYPSRFRYDLTRNARVALFSDFGTGLAHSRYIAKFIAARGPDFAIHLGDVYYSGRQAEVSRFYDQPLAPLVAMHELWSIPGNHDYYSDGGPFFASLDARRDGVLGGRKHRQEGSYFCLDTPAFRILGIDGEYHSGTRYEDRDLKLWLARAIAEARSAGRTVILMSSDEPYSYDSERENDLLHDVTGNLPPDAIDLWFWGNTHYCAMFEPTDRVRPKFYGSCIGHGGFQYKTLDHQSSERDVAQILWAEREPRFPRWTAVRPDMGNNGFCMMTLDDDHRAVTLDYVDWTNAPRATISFATANGRLAVVGVKEHPRPECR